MNRLVNNARIGYDFEAFKAIRKFEIALILMFPVPRFPSVLDDAADRNVIDKKFFTPAI